MKIVSLEERKGKTCHFCGETRSVKYLVNDKPCCNRCAAIRIWKEKYGEEEV